MQTLKSFIPLDGLLSYPPLLADPIGYVKPDASISEDALFMGAVALGVCYAYIKLGKPLFRKISDEKEHYIGW